MPFYERKDIAIGAYMTLDAPRDAPPLQMSRSPPPPPVRYGDHPFAEVSERLDAARERLQSLIKDLRNARRV